MAVRVPKSTRTRGREEVEAETLDVREGPVELEELLEYRDALHSLCQRIVGDSATADDMVQETYLRALKNLDQLERRPSLMPWLTTVAKRRSIDELRARRRTTPTDDLPVVVAGDHDDPEARVPASDTVRRVREALTLLNERERHLLTRQVDDGLSLAELAKEDDSSVDSVRSVLVRARAKLRDAITGDIGFPAAAPLAAILATLRRRLRGLNLRAQRTFSTTPLDRWGEILTAGVVTVALGATPTVINAGTASLSGEHAGDSPSASTSAAAASHDDTGPASVAGITTTAGAPRPVTESLPGSATVELLLPPDDVENTDDAAFTSFAAGSNGGTVLAAGTRRQGCVTGCTVLFRSEDSGESWERLPAQGMTGTTIVAAPGYPDDPRIFASGDEGLSISRDGGQTFAFALPSGPAALVLSPAFGSGDERVFIGSGPALVWDEATRSATPLLGLPTSPSTHFAFAPGYPSAGSLFVGSAAPGSSDFESAVYRCRYAVSEDSCVESTSMRDLDRPPEVTVINASASVLAWAGPQMRRSTDDARSFAATTIPGGLHVGAVVSSADGTIYAASYHPSGGAAGVLRSQDDGRTWKTFGAGTALAHGVSAVAALPGGQILAAPLAQAGGDIYCSGNQGVTWEKTCS